MSQYHEIKVIYLPKNEIIEFINIHDDFFCYIGVTQPFQYELIENFPVFYPDEKDLENLERYQYKNPTNKGISLTGINVLNSTSFEELLLITVKWRQTLEDLDDYTVNKLDYEFTLDELTSNIKKLLTFLKNESLNKADYILLWEGI